ncbi:MAG: universal stress protein [Corynebacterium sp.]|nr:universal stress protein [Corynebacterium sp.]
MQLVVVAVDGSAASLAAVKWGAVEASKRGATLRVASSYEPPRYLYAGSLVPPENFFEDLHDEAEKIAAEAAESVKDIVAAEVTVVESNPVDMLLEMSKEATMIVMGTRGRGEFKGAMLGSVSAAVVSHADCPVVVIRDDASFVPDGPIVVGVDGSEVSDRAVEHAFEEAKERGVELLAVHTWADVQFPVSEEHWRDIEQEERDLLLSRLEAPLAKYPEVTVETLISRERPATALSQAAADAQLLIVGSHGRGGFRGMLLGSTSRALLQDAPCPMMVVRPKKK